MTTEDSIRSHFFIYVSKYLADNGHVWGLNDVPKCCCNTTFTFDTRAEGAPLDSPLFTLHTWSFQNIPAPTREQLLAISEQDFINEKKYLHALRTKRDVILGMNQIRSSLNLQPMSKADIIGLVDYVPPI